MKRARLWLTLLTLAVPLSAQAAGNPGGAPAPLPFPDLWKQVDLHSPAQRGAALETQAARAQESRAGNYRLPQVYLRGQYVNSDDPALSFMSKLRQREIESRDFTPARLNTPDAGTFGEAALGVTVPLYEGGLGSAQASAAADAARASEQDRAAIRVRQFAQAFEGYGVLLALQSAGTDVDTLAAEVGDTLSRYQLGSAANPVGYSGLLGMKSLALRLQIMGNGFRAQQRTTQATLSTLAELDAAAWIPAFEPVEAYIDAHAPRVAGSPAQVQREPESYPVRSLRALADSVRRKAQAERAPLLPQVGLFVEGNAAMGDRGTANSYVAGAYVRWNFYSPTQAGAAQEAILRSQALQERANAAAIEDRIAVAEGQQTEAAVRERLALLKQSQDLLDEQLRTGKRMFANGTITALQLAETYSKRVDLTQSLLESELALLQARRATILHRPEVPDAQ